MNKNDEKIQELVNQYILAIETQDKALFESLWSTTQPLSLISIASLYEGKEAIAQEFLMDKIHQSYASIRLIPEEIKIHYINDKQAIMIFQYRTECIKRKTGEPYGIAGVETQVAILEDKWKLVHVHYSKKNDMK